MGIRAGSLGCKWTDSHGTLKGYFDVVCIQLASIHWRLVLPVDPLADREDDRCGIGHFPLLCQVRLDNVYGHKTGGEFVFFSGYSPVADAQFLQNGRAGDRAVPVVPGIRMLELNLRGEGDGAAVPGLFHQLPPYVADHFGLQLLLGLGMRAGT